MAAKETITLLIHGANQAKRTEDDNRRTWQEALDVEQHSQRVRDLMDGKLNDEIAEHHEQNHAGRDYPGFTGWTPPWYGNVWQNVEANEEPLADRLNKADLIESAHEGREKVKELVERVERLGMQKHFDELVPFYELAVLNNGKTLYEAICQRLLDQLVDATKDGRHYVLIAHSMGCAVSYNVMSHISCAGAGKNYCPINGTLSNEYRNEVAKFVDSGSKCFGLMTFGNYTAYNWCQRLNNQILFGESAKQYVYPDAVGRWCNFWTRWGGDPYILDDQLDEDMVDDEDDQFEDVAVTRIPLTNIGHSRQAWFKRNKFSKKLYRKMAFHLYL